MKLALLLPDGVGVRNFVLGRFLDEARARGPVHAFLVMPAPAQALDAYRTAAGPAVTWHKLPPEAGGRVAETLRSAAGYAHMYWARTRAMERRLRRRTRAPSLGRYAMTTTARLLGRLAASRSGIRMLDAWHRTAMRRAPSVRAFRERWSELRPDIVFCSHQRPPEAVAPILAARELGIPTATFIFSWDNLTSKPRIPAPFDHYLVWSPLMRRELLALYPEVRPERVHVVGTPQFDPYADAALLWRREEFCRRVGADPARPLICFSGGDAGTCPEDPAHLRILLDLIRAGRIPSHPQVLLRPSPADDGRRFDEVRRDYPELVYAPPAWIRLPGGGWAHTLPLPEDIALLANVTYHCQLNVNHASTMTLDFAIRDRPVVNLAFDVANPPPLGAPSWDVYYQFEHYRPVVELGAVRVARSPDELAAHINAYLAEPSLDRAARRRLVELEVDLPIGRAAQRAVETLAEVA